MSLTLAKSTDMFQVTVRTFLRAGKLYITDMRGPYTNVSYFHYRSGLVFTRTHTTCTQACPGTRAIPVMPPGDGRTN